MDLEKESASIRVDTGVAKDIAQSCNELLELQKQIEWRFSFLKGLHEFNFKNYNNAIGRTGFSPLIRGEEYNKRALFLS